MHFSGKNEEFGGIKSPPSPPPKKKSLKCSDNAYRGVDFCKTANAHDFFETLFSRSHDKTPNLTVFWEIF